MYVETYPTIFALISASVGTDLTRKSTRIELILSLLGILMRECARVRSNIYWKRGRGSRRVRFDRMMVVGGGDLLPCRIDGVDK
jgi:hypothetical protein